MRDDHSVSLSLPAGHAQNGICLMPPGHAPVALQLDRARLSVDQKVVDEELPADVDLDHRRRRDEVRWRAHGPGQVDGRRPHSRQADPVVQPLAEA